MARLPNRVVIGALDSALNRVDSDIRRWQGKGNGADFLSSLREERAALQEARNFIADKRRD